MSQRYLLIIYFILLIPVVDAQGNREYGLQFNSYEVEKENRTGLNLTPEKAFSFSDGFTLEFDARFEEVHHVFGYVFRIVAGDGQHLDLVLGRAKDSPNLGPQLSFIYEWEKILCAVTFDELQIKYNEWFKVSVTIDKRENKIKLKLGNTELDYNEILFKDLGNVRIVFGKNNIPSYQVSDVPTMAVRNIAIKNAKARLDYFWPLAEHTEEGVFDSVKNHFAKVENPDWLLDSHAYWKKSVSFSTNIYPKIFYNSNDNFIITADSNYFYSYRIGGDLIVDTIKEGYPIGNLANQLLYDENNEKYFTYDFIEKIATYDPVAKSWNNPIIGLEDSQYWHHNRYFSSVENKLYTFGGYGFHLYKNDVNTYDFTSGQWKKFSLNGEGISPRYLSGLGKIDESTLLIFGGYGNESGRQELSPRSYYDLYEVNIPDLNVKKKWELTSVDSDFVVANSLLVDTLNRCFYALGFPHHKFNTQLQLYRFSLDNPEYKPLADSIPYLFNDGFSYADLYISSDSTKLIALTVYNDTESALSHVSIYTLAFPPLQRSDLLQDAEKANGFFIKSLIIILAVLVLLAIIYFLIRLRKKYTLKYSDSGNTVLPSKENLLVGDKENKKIQRQAIFLFGDFRVLDKNGADITSRFTPILKQLFLLILLYTYKDGKGISSQKLNEILWFDKDRDKAKNNRGVSMSKLRLIFEDVGAIEINSHNSNWTVQLEDEIYCDYLKAVSLMELLTKELHNQLAVEDLVSVVSSGELLADLQIDWVDNFKSDFSNKLIDILLTFVNSEFDISSSLKIKIADAIFIHDSLNEDALRLKCMELVKAGKNGLAKKIYESFTREYKSAIGTDFKTPFDQLIL